MQLTVLLRVIIQKPSLQWWDKKCSDGRHSKVVDCISHSSTASLFRFSRSRSSASRHWCASGPICAGGLAFLCLLVSAKACFLVSGFAQVRLWLEDALLYRRHVCQNRALTRWNYRRGLKKDHYFKCKDSYWKRWRFCQICCENSTQLCLWRGVGLEYCWEQHRWA